MSDLIELYTAAPDNYDGFSAKTVAVVGKDLKSGRPVRKVTVERRDYDWLTGRYDSGMHLYTSERVKGEQLVALGDWHLFDLARLEGILKLAADEPAKLRACDIDRVMAAAHDAGCGRDFTSWLYSVVDPMLLSPIGDWAPAL